MVYLCFILCVCFTSKDFVSVPGPVGKDGSVDKGIFSSASIFIPLVVKELRLGSRVRYAMLAVNDQCINKRLALILSIG